MKGHKHRAGTPRDPGTTRVAPLSAVKSSSSQDIEGVLSNYFSMSYAAPHLFGDRVEEFAGELRELLRERSPASEHKP